MDVSIIFVNYNTINLLIDAIDSILIKSRGFVYEIIVVDNNSTDESQDFLNEKFGNSITYISLPENIGFGQANNAGVKIAKGRYVLFLNPDILLINNAIKILIDFLDKNPSVGVVGGNLYCNNSQPAYSYSRFLPGILSTEISLMAFGFDKHFIKDSVHNQTNTPLKVRSTSGADMLIRKSLIENLGYFYPEFFMYYEDTELCWRVKKAGYEIVNIPAAKFIHFDSQSFTDIETKLRMSLKSRAKFYEITRGPLYRKIADLLYLLAVNLNIILLNAFKKDHTHYVRLKKLLKELYF